MLSFLEKESRIEQKRDPLRLLGYSDEEDDEDIIIILLLVRKNDNLLGVIIIF